MGCYVSQLNTESAFYLFLVRVYISFRVPLKVSIRDSGSFKGIYKGL